MLRRVPWGWLAVALGGAVANLILAHSVLIRPPGDGTWDALLVSGIVGVLVNLRWPVLGWALIILGWIPGFAIYCYLFAYLFQGIPEALTCVAPAVVQAYGAARVAGSLR